MNPHKLLELAHAAGLTEHWTDAFGKPQQVSHESLRRVLCAMELECDNDEQCVRSIVQLAGEEQELALPPLLTAEVHTPITLSPLAGLHGQAYRIVLEQGGELHGRFTQDRAAALTIPAIGESGYHLLQTGQRQVSLAVAPPRCFSIADAVASESGRPRLWALAAQLYSLRRHGDGGIGDYTALATLARAAARHGASALAISPVHATFSADVWRYSPYGPSSRLFFNAMHIDPAALDAVQTHAPMALEQNELIDWPASGAWRLQQLRLMYARFRVADGASHEAFEHFCRDGGSALEDHARFEALHAAHGAADWHAWPPEHRDPRSTGVDAFARRCADEVRFHAFLQWQAASGLHNAQVAAREAGMPIGLITDLAVGADRGGSQAWSRSAQMLNGVSVGAPPDLLNPFGQCWGLAAFSPRALRRHGYQAYIEMLRAAFRYAGGVRIDHILGLARMWLVPDGAPGAEGVYLRFPFADLARLIALESHRHRAIVIGEDLGTVPQGFEDALAQAGLLGIRVLWFERHGERFKPPREWSRDAIATTATHDLPTVAGWWKGTDIGWRAALDLLPQGTDVDSEHAARARDRQALSQALGLPVQSDDAPLDEVMGYVGATAAPLVVVPLEDALGLAEQPNLPGTVGSHPNWRRRMPQTADKLLDAAPVAHRLGILARVRREEGAS